MNKNYNPHELEPKIQQHWESEQTFKTSENIQKEKFYCLSMLPYPSGELHMGHVRNYTIGDVIARFEHMRGKNVLQPMGWDAFGLPAENAALKNGLAPSQWTYQNINQMRQQLKRMGFAIDWKREVTTCSPAYYRWEQWLFTRLYKKGLAYKKNAIVNWDPVDKTVLANEQVVDGRGWRSGALVERREISQWFLKITDYAEELLHGLDKLPDWPEQVRTMQRNWIGRSEGVEVHFEVTGHTDILSVYTTRADTLAGATYLAIAPEHPLAKQAAQNNQAVADFIHKCQNIKVAEAEIATMQKEGIDSGYQAIHPITHQPLPIWVANYVLIEYGSGAVMAVPAHDARDFEFAQQYHLPIKQVIQPCDHSVWDFKQAALTEPGKLINSGQFDGLDSKQALNAIADFLIQQNKGKKQVHYRLRDWGVSRQRYWGTPIPIIYCDHCGTLPVPEKDLPVVLPENVVLTDPHSPLKSMPEFYQTPCPACGKPAHRETDTFDTFMESSWYYARYACPDQNNAMLDARACYWTPVDQYVGGIEHAVMHLLYARFMHKLLRDEGLLNSNEPFKRLLTQGMVLKDGVKMSKSKGNTVSPQTLIDQYGADTVRVFSMFAAPPEQSLEWSDSGVEGAHRFLKRLWSCAAEIGEQINQYCRLKKSIEHEQLNADQLSIRREIHEILQKAHHDMERSQFNTVVSGAMKLLNILTKISPASGTNVAILAEGYKIILQLLAPIAPHITFSLWQELGYGHDIIKASWPEVDYEALITDSLTLVVQINGKLRGQIIVASDADEKTIQSTALNDPQIQRFLADKLPKKMIVVPKKLINIVV